MNIYELRDILLSLTKDEKNVNISQKLIYNDFINSLIQGG